MPSPAVGVMPPKTKLHILSLLSDLKKNKAFLKSIANCKTSSQKKAKIKFSSAKEIKVLQRLICAYTRKEIGISKNILAQLKKAKKYNFVLKNFDKLNSQKNLREKLLVVANVLPLFIKPILSKPSKH